jgi:thiamine biosynthesis lipoprotein
MGTDVAVVIPARARSLALEVEALFEAWERQLSRFRPESELSRLNEADGREVLVGGLLFAVTEAALLAAAATDGLFDPTLLRPLEALGYDRTFERVEGAAPRLDPIAPGYGLGPDLGADERVLRARERPVARNEARPVGRWREVRLDRRLRSITLPTGVGLDFGGIAKGMAVDASIAHLAAQGVGSALVEAGGDLAVVGRPPEGAGWPIEVETGSNLTAIELDWGGFATSSVGRRRWVAGGKVRHHLLDPSTGAPARTDAWAMSVAAPTCQQAEVAAKVALILGVDRGEAFLDRLGFGGLVTTTRGQVRRVGAWGSVATPESPARPEQQPTVVAAG